MQERRIEGAFPEAPRKPDDYRHVPVSCHPPAYGRRRKKFKHHYTADGDYGTLQKIPIMVV
jgi:hypothetical protein